MLVKKIALRTLLMLLLVLMMMQISGLAVAQETIKLNFGYTMPPGAPPANGWEWWAKELDNRTNGRVKITFHPSGVLFQLDDSLDAIATGVADIGDSSPTALGRNFPIFQAHLMPGTVFPQTANGSIAASEAYMKLLGKYPELQSEWKRWKVLWFNALATSLLHSKKKVRVPSDLKGMKVGGIGSISPEIVKASGGVSVRMAPPDAYTALDTGVVDAHVFNWSGSYAYKYHEKTKYHLDYSFSTGGSTLVILMNLQKWNVLPPDVQKLMMDLAPEARAMGIKGSLQRVEMGKDAAKARGNEIITPTIEEIKQWEAVAKPVEEKWLSEMKAKGVTIAQDLLNDLKKLAKEAPK